MKKNLILILLLIVACKPKLTIAEFEADKNLNTTKIIANHYKNKKYFSTLYIKANVRYKDDKQFQNVIAEIKIKKDEIILVSVRFFGITMAKALITPKKVHYYEKIGGSFFEGDYTVLSRWLGSELDFYKIQNMLLGQAIDDLKPEKYIAIIENELYKLENKSKENINKSYYFEASNFLIKKQEVEQINPPRDLKVYYLNHKEYLQAILPVNVVIEASNQEKNVTIKIEYNTIIFDEQFSFPYTVPEGYKRIFID